MKVTVFGGSQPQPGDPAYNEALLLGKLLGQAGHTVLTGGYIGTMEAVSRGAAEAGGHVIGVTCEEIERWRPARANRWVQEEWRYNTLTERLMALINGCQAAIALPGGPGTLAEISVMWNHMLIDAIAHRPLILVGAGWKGVYEELFTRHGKYVPEHDRALLTFSNNVEEAFVTISNQKG
jgi:uncharacterized protein (TIGR00730 family)